MRKCDVAATKAFGIGGFMVIALIGIRTTGIDMTHPIILAWWGINLAAFGIIAVGSTVVMETSEEFAAHECCTPCLIINRLLFGVSVSSLLNLLLAFWYK